MNSFEGHNEKRWFVYVGDHHEGPFSVSDMDSQMSAGRVSPGSYLWTEGMSDWKPMTDIPDFAAVLSDRAAAAPTEPIDTAGVIAPAVQILEPPRDESAQAMGQAAVAAVFEVPAAEPAAAEAPRAAESDLEQFRQAEEIKARDDANRNTGGRLKRVVLIGLPLAGAALITVFLMSGYRDAFLKSPALQALTHTLHDAAEPYLLKLADQIPVLGKYISPIRTLDDVLPDEYETLKAAARGRANAQDPQTARVGVALSQGDLGAPTFYVASNLPEGTRFDLFIDGVPDTLLNQLSFSAKATAILTKKLGQSGPVRFPDGKSLASGEYRVSVTESEAQPPETTALLNSLPAARTESASPSVPKGHKIAVSQTYFLGGKKDAMYTSRLKEFHERWQARAKADLDEVRQFEAVLDNQLGSTMATFSNLKHGKLTPAQKRTWAKFEQKWAPLQASLSENFRKWSPSGAPDSLDQDHFYAVLYRMTRQAGEAVSRAHLFHNAYFTTKVDPKAFEIQAAEATSGAQAAISALKAKIEQAEKLPLSPGGLPRREGL